MNERPILFSGEMVRAILEGRKTQTRRIVKNQPILGVNGYTLKVIQEEAFEKYGKPGDRLWVRETWSVNWHSKDWESGVVDDWGNVAPSRIKKIKTAEELLSHETLIYRADEKFMNESIEDRGFKWHPSIHMPRWASRITLEITDIRVEQLQDISEEDAVAEGIDQLFDKETRRRRPECDFDSWANYLWHGHIGRTITGKQSDAWEWQYSGYKKARDSFSSLWESINGPGSWDKNPWVWVINFKVVKP